MIFVDQENPSFLFGSLALNMSFLQDCFGGKVCTYIGGVSKYAENITLSASVKKSEI